MNKFGFKTLTPDNWLEPDQASSLFVKLSKLDGSVSSMTGEDWLQLFLTPTLTDSVPENIHALFEVARGSLAYGFFFYPLYTFGSDQLPRVAETAVTEKCHLLGAPKSLKNFHNRLQHLRKKGIVSDEEFSEWDKVRKRRNDVSHPDTQNIIFPGMAARMLKDMAERINKLFE